MKTRVIYKYEIEIIPKLIHYCGFDFAHALDRFNARGQEGWRLVMVFHLASSDVAIFELAQEGSDDGDLKPPPSGT